jgi:hypothetical protein
VDLLTTGMQEPDRKHARLRSLENQIRRLHARLARMAVRSDLYSRSQTAIVLFGAVATYITFKVGGETAGWVVLAVLFASFCWDVYCHRRLKRGILRFKTWTEIKSIQLARVKLDWEQLPQPLPVAPDGRHPFEIDLDITGPRSLHRLIDTCVTIEGSELLRTWLLETAPDLQTTRERQDLLSDIVPLSLFRDKLQLSSALASGGAIGRWNASSVVEWLNRNPSRPILPALILLAILAAANLTLLALSSLGLMPALWPFSLLIYITAMIMMSGRVKPALGVALKLESSLWRFKAVFEHLENHNYRKTPALAALCRPFRDPSSRPSAELKGVARLVSALSLQSNPFISAWVHAVVPWSFFFAYLLNKRKARIAKLIPIWLDAWFELEALNSLANFAYLNPDYIFPEIVAGPDPDGPMVFQALKIGHPLIPNATRVCNDFELGSEERIAIITGSNMAGKSTFLRTLGVNLCLAYVGGPVCASSFQTASFRVFSCIKVSDSVTDGLSYFYAEVKRLKALLTAVDSPEPPVFFLIDEIFRGTNNRERQIGSCAYIKALAERACIGAIATHDLELVKLADEIGGIANYHFREEVWDGRMTFDYKLRRGPCPTTNALRIMQMEGLPMAKIGGK